MQYSIIESTTIADPHTTYIVFTAEKHILQKVPKDIARRYGGAYREKSIALCREQGTISRCLDMLQSFHLVTEQSPQEVLELIKKDLLDHTELTVNDIEYAITLLQNSGGIERWLNQVLPCQP